MYVSWSIAFQAIICLISYSHSKQTDLACTFIFYIAAITQLLICANLIATMAHNAERNGKMLSNGTFILELTVNWWGWWMGNKFIWSGLTLVNSVSFVLLWIQFRELEHSSGDQLFTCWCNSMEFYPPKYWGLDPLYFACVKLTISDVLNLKEHPLSKGNVGTGAWTPTCIQMSCSCIVFYDIPVMRLLG